MFSWPNWVDLFVITIVLTTGYRGFHRGLITGILSLLVGALFTAVVISYQGVVLSAVQPWLRTDPTVSTFLIFWCIFAVTMLVMCMALKLILRFFTWEKMNGLTQLLSLVVGLLRGSWWAGVLLLGLSSSGIDYLHKSVEERSVTAPVIVPPVRAVLEQLEAVFPGGEMHSSGSLLPPLVAARQ